MDEWAPGRRNGRSVAGAHPLVSSTDDPRPGAALTPRRSNCLPSASRTSKIAGHRRAHRNEFLPLRRARAITARPRRATIERSMSDVISEYQKWKQMGDDLRLKAKQAMESRFRELLAEAAQIAEEYRADFGSVLKPPSAVSVFRYKAHAKTKGKKGVKEKVASSTAPEKTNPRQIAVQKRPTAAKRKPEEAKTGGKATRPFEDKIYEIEDELRLASQAR